MSTIEKAIQKLRKLSHEFELTHNSTEIHSNASFFEEERSQDFQDSDLSLQEDLSDQWDMSSICTDNSIIPSQTSEKITDLSSQSNPNQVIMNAHIVKQRFEDFISSNIKNNNSQIGKGIAIHVLGQGSIGKSNKKGKKLEKSNIKKIQNLNNQINNLNNINNSQDQQLQQSSFSNQNTQQKFTSQQNKQICQSQKFILAYLMVECDIQKQAHQRALNFMQKFMPDIKNKELLLNIEETYKIMLLPDQILYQLAQVLCQEERLQHLNLFLHRLNLPNNCHPLAAKAVDKISKHFKDSY
ncbi:unnamed protein product [Paramecium sonneborni]|uniref:Uncharacterized protein n=1 Tax=Paramecium sonneborni TaxID=65129 RepID=A0A8S1PUG8_9CILI|nr:unnamed protein product [Paramecium sonneborni]